MYANSGERRGKTAKLECWQWTEDEASVDRSSWSSGNDLDSALHRSVPTPLLLVALGGGARYPVLSFNLRSLSSLTSNLGAVNGTNDWWAEYVQWSYFRYTYHGAQWWYQNPPHSRPPRRSARTQSIPRLAVFPYTAHLSRIACVEYLSVSLCSRKLMDPKL